MIRNLSDLANLLAVSGALALAGCSGDTSAETTTDTVDSGPMAGCPTTGCPTTGCPTTGCPTTGCPTSTGDTGNRR